MSRQPGQVGRSALTRSRLLTSRGLSSDTSTNSCGSEVLSTWSMRTEVAELAD